MSYLEQAIGLNCRRGLIHMTPAAIAGLPAPFDDTEGDPADSERDPGRVRDGLPGDRHRRPVGTPGATQDWAFATTGVNVYLGPVRYPTPKEAVQRDINLVTFIAEAYVLAVWDGIDDRRPCQQPQSWWTGQRRQRRRIGQWQTFVGSPSEPAWSGSQGWTPTATSSRANNAYVTDKPGVGGGQPEHRGGHAVLGAERVRLQDRAAKFPDTFNNWDLTLTLASSSRADRVAGRCAPRSRTAPTPSVWRTRPRWPATEQAPKVAFEFWAENGSGSGLNADVPVLPLGVPVQHVGSRGQHVRGGAGAADVQRGHPDERELGRGPVR